VRQVLLLARKDLRSLVRSPWAVLLLIAYLLAMTGLLGWMFTSQPEPRIALVNEDKTGDSVKIGSERFGIETYREQAERSGVTIVESERDEALRALDQGQVAGVLLIPNGAIAKLRTQLSPTTLKLYTGNHALGRTTLQRVRGVVYRINLQISEALIETNAAYLKTLVTGGEVEVSGETYELAGLDPIKKDLEDVLNRLGDDATEEDEEALQTAIEFAEDASIALELADNALEATAAPIRLEHEDAEGKGPLLTATALSYGLAILVAFFASVIVAASLAAERDERVLGRLLRGIVRPWHVIGSKLVFGSVAAFVVAATITIPVALFADQAWSRLPLLIPCILLAGLASAGLGSLLAVLTRNAGAATLATILVIMPLVLLSLVPGETALLLSRGGPIAPAQNLFNSVLFELHPVRESLGPLLQLALFTVVTAGLSARLLRRLV